MTDLELINSVKEKNDSTALNELISKVSGLYITTVTGYTYVPHFERQELIDNKYYNIYNYIQDYDPSKGMSFTSYVAQRTKWKCQSLISKYPEPEQLNESLKEEEFYNIENEDIYNYILECVEDIDDKRFFDIFKYRNGSNKKYWKEIGKIYGITNEGARKIYNRNLERIKNKIIKDIKK